MSGEKSAMIRIVSILYCHDICSEFRSPVEELYPDLKDEYLSIIKYPMDLGSILINCINQKMTVEALCRALQLVFVNALVFNKGTPVMESLATHLYMFAGELYEEAIGRHYYLTDNANDDDIDLKRLNERHNRILFVQNIPLVNTEIKYFIDSLERVKLQVPNELNKFIKNAINTANDALENGDENITIYKLLSPIINAVVQYNSEDNKSIGLSTLPSLFELIYPRIKAIKTKEKHAENDTAMDVDDDEGNETMLKISNALLPYLCELDAALGELFIILKERGTRGIATSSVWARTYRMLWAQPNKGGLFPCMLLAGGPLTDVPTYINKANWERIPPNIMKQLIKCRPKVAGAPPATTNWSDSNVPNDYYVVEYFGNHEFGFVKSENVTAMPIDEFVVPPKSTHNGAEAMGEAKEAFHTMKEMNDISSLNSRTVIVVPTVTELEETTNISSKDAVKVFEKIQSIPVNIFAGLSESLKNVSAFGNTSKTKAGSKNKGKEPKDTKDEDIKDTKDATKETKEVKEVKEVKEAREKNLFVHSVVQLLLNQNTKIAGLLQNVQNVQNAQLEMKDQINLKSAESQNAHFVPTDIQRQSVLKNQIAQQR